VGATLTEQAALAVSDGFQCRVHAAMTAAAASIAGIAQGSMGPQTYAARVALATSILQDAGPHLARFSWAMATNAAVFNDMHQPVAIAGTTGNMPAVITTEVPHGFTTGQVAEISDAVDPSVNGTWLITVVDQSSFSIPSPGSSFPAEGGFATIQPSDNSLQTAVNVCWNGLAGITSATV
jgi:hypothetical protein